ncbi:phosphoribosylglycinamide formyltransferase-1 [Dyadobacter jejuensis]|uniref:Phosphoribosylglycinamide formyltransferase n=1 Tax=Dyadobacter jejuensis TaxID=1082580 RepID=A0A316B709_9BACT|nr:phosphoribosylglycinamide formyltransferase [Dyadobacter jejuensis]PWJ58377.1 phosphoribosylglycinamide formyltransferase-1 [Dyadobacter jejuensis]
MNRIALFASGSGTNAEKIFEYFENQTDVEISLVLTNNPDAGVIRRARKFSIPTLVFDRKSFYDTGKILNLLKNEGIDFIILAGFMMLIPDAMVKAYPNRMVNIHPALLPKFGGKGMYGHFVHEAVKEAQEIESGITIHFVNEHYDEGNIIFQAHCSITPADSPEDIARKVQVLEHKHYPEVIDSILQNLAD